MSWIPTNGKDKRYPDKAQQIIVKLSSGLMTTYHYTDSDISKICLSEQYVSWFDEQDEGWVPVFDGILQFSKVTFPDAGPVEHLRKLVQEAWEAAKAPDDITEYADCLLCLFAAAGKSGITLDQLVTAATDKLEECKGRKWQRQNDGTYQHIRPTTKD